ncbi:hypothetical protein HRbin17_01412 [bacterium HR17]|uniref:RNA polymerase sigma factor 54 DNA-binding domain-containing protein n=1 Tax=Candidatus Fervidibacter japonicus TaxID=2035412 RepID=A0A2H5XCJ9_9BACT|nr:hypothetical protein HRbin17_01412 [bacterium HR17]
MRLRPSVHPKLKPALRRPSVHWRRAFASEQSARQLAEWVERHELFRALASAGVIRKLRWDRYLPRDRYLAFMERHAVAFVHRHRLYDRPEWQFLLTHPRAEEFLPDWAQQWGVPERELRRVIRYLRQYTPPRQDMLLADFRDEQAVPAPSGVDDFGELIDLATDFVRRYGVSQQEFVDYFLSGRYSPEVIAQRFGCSVAEARSLLDALDHLEVQEMVVGAPLTMEPLPQVPATDSLLAEVWVDNEGQVRWRFVQQRYYLRYLIDWERLAEWKRRQGTAPALTDLLDALQALNERSGVLASLVHRVCQAQREFLVTGAPLSLRPLTQAEVARQIGCHRSVVCRLVRGQWIKTPHGRIPLTDLLPRTQEIVARLFHTYPDWSDQQIADYLQQRWGVRLSRRTVTYHRHRAQANGALPQTARRSKGHSRA